MVRSEIPQLSSLQLLFSALQRECDGFIYQLQKYHLSSQFFVHPDSPPVRRVQNISPERHQDFLTRRPNQLNGVLRIAYVSMCFVQLVKNGFSLNPLWFYALKCVLWMQGDHPFLATLCRFLAVCFILFFFFVWSSFSCDPPHLVSWTLICCCSVWHFTQQFSPCRLLY